MKKLLLPLLGALIALPTLARDFTYTYEGQTINYTVIDEEAKTCQVTTNSDVAGSVKIPEIAIDASDNYSVTSIGGSAFRGCSGLTSVAIPNSVTQIGKNAFNGCSALTSITIPNSVTTIKEDTFTDCCGLTSITIGNSVNTIENFAFDNCSSLTSVIFPNAVTKIGMGAFIRCSGLLSVNISEYVSMLGAGAFGGCTSLKAINVAVGNSNYTSVDGVVYSKDMSKLVQYPAGKEQREFTIPHSVIEIVNRAFYGCSGLTAVNISNSVTEIGSSAFYECSGLTSVNIPNSVTELDIRTFCRCTGLTSVTIPNSVTEIHSDAFLGCSSLTSITYLAEEPVASDSDLFDDETYQKATLNYLKSAEEKIATTEPWSRFVNRIGRDADYKEEGAISEVQTTDGSANTVYNLRGVKVGTSTDGLPKGIYIVREGSTTRKIAI